MAKARIASKIQSKLGTLIFGEQFTGKSTLASQLAYFKRPDGKPFRLLYLDPESGSIDDYLPDLESNGVDIANIYIVYTQSLGEVRQYISRVKNNEDFPVLDDEGNETTTYVDDIPFRIDLQNNTCNINGSSYSSTIANVAIRSQCDANGNVISDTYVTIDEFNSVLEQIKTAIEALNG